MADFLPVNQLDFATLRTSLKEFLQNQDQFKDYDFEGSNISVLLDLLAYNSYQNAFYLNMIGNEMFLDTSILRDSVVSHAKELNYTPRSYTSAVANITVNLTVNDTQVTSVVIPRGTRFTGTGSGSTYSFVTDSAYTVFRNNNTFQANVQIYEGYLLTEKYIVTGNADQRFVLSNDKVDTRSVFVTVFSSSGDSVGTTYTKASSLYNLDSTSTIYFVQGAEDGKYELVFGDGVYGKELTAGNIVAVNYRIATGEEVNGISSFSVNGNIGGYAATVTTVNSPASGGAANESTESIKYNAPRHFQTQERAITIDDYRTLIQSNFPSVKSTNIYGGEDVLDRPAFGLVYISGISTDGTNLSDSLKQEILEYVNTKSIFAINPVIIDPEYINLVMGLNVSYNTNLTTSTQNTIEALIRTTVSNYSNNNLEAFSKNFRGSRLTTALNTSDTTSNSIVSSEIISLWMRKDITPQLSIPLVATIDFGASVTTNTKNPFYAGDDTEASALTHDRIVYSSPFTYNGNVNSYLQDDGSGKLVVISTTGVNSTIVNNNAGTVDYENGIVKINGLNISSYTGNYFSIFAKSRFQDIFANKNNIITIDDSSLTVNVIAVSE